jgi:hypothetical protein
MALAKRSLAWLQYRNTKLLERVAPSPDNAITVICGPSIRINFMNKMLVEQLGFRPDQNYVTLEERIDCGIGKFVGKTFGRSWFASMDRSYRRKERAAG